MNYNKSKNMLVSISCMLSILLATSVTSAPATDDERRRLNYQNRLDDYSFLTDATFAATHNSYHSSGDGYGGILNHNASRAEQVSAGIQLLNYDVRLNTNFGSQVTFPSLCHETCFWDADSLVEGLNDIEDNLLTHPNKVIFLLFELKESASGNTYPKILADLQAHSIRHLLYTPAHFDASYANTDTCRGLPIDEISEADIRSSVGSANGSALVILNWHKDRPASTCPTDDEALWNYTWAYRAKEANVNNDTRGTDRWGQYAENRGVGSGIIGDPVSGTEITRLLEEYGANFVGLDHIVEQDEGGDRFHRQIWSWGDGEPHFGDDSTKGCVTAEFDDANNAQGWKTANCGVAYRAACQRINSQLDNANQSLSWRVTSRLVLVTEAEAACQELGSDFHFAGPLNPQQAAHMGFAATGFNSVLLNVRMDAEYANENGEPQYAVRVAGSHIPGQQLFLFDRYQSNTLLQEVDNLHAAYDRALLDFNGAEQAWIDAEEEYDAAYDALKACQADPNCSTHSSGTYARYTLAYEKSIAASDFYLGGALTALNSARSTWAAKRTEYQSNAAQTDLTIESGTVSGVDEAFDPIHFANSFSATPAIFTNMQTSVGTDTADLRIDLADSDGFSVAVQEEQSQDTEVDHYEEDVAYLALSPGLIHNQAGTAIGESGLLNVTQDRDDQWFSFNQHLGSYTNPVVIMIINSYNGTHAAHMRVRAVNATSFEYQLEEWDYLDGNHTTESVAYLIVESGSHTLANGQTLQAFTVMADEKIKTITYTNSFSVTPIVFSQTQTTNGNVAVNTRQQNINSTTMQVFLQEEEARDNIHVDERVGFVVLGDG